MTTAPLAGARILVTGVSGQVAQPVAVALAADNDVIGIARFGNERVRADLESAGVTCIPVDLMDPDLSAVPADVDYVANFAVAKTGDFDRDLAANVEAVGLLMAHLKGTRAFLHCSTTGVYEADGHRHFKEDDPLGDNHRTMFATYSITKIAAEAMVRFGARAYGIPSVIARLNVPYGDSGGWPWFHMEQLLAGQAIQVSADPPSEYNPIHSDDIIASVPALLAAATVPALIVNWGGDEVVSIEEWVGYLAELLGTGATFESSPTALPPVAIDTTRFREISGGTTVDWRGGLRRMVAHFHPELELT